MRKLNSTLLTGLFIVCCSFLLSRNDVIRKENNILAAANIAVNNDSIKSVDSLQADENELPFQFVDFAKKFIGTAYSWGSVNPKIGLDCSGFVNVVASHFGISVPRSSVDFTHLGLDIDPSQAKTGDIILFTGTNIRNRVVGHMGIVTNNDDGDIQFIHSSSGHKNGVQVSELDGYYKTRFVKIIRIFPLAPDKIVS
jgi:hypothetical protein